MDQTNVPKILRTKNEAEDYIAEDDSSTSFFPERFPKRSPTQDHTSQRAHVHSKQIGLWLAHVTVVFFILPDQLPRKTPRSQRICSQAQLANMQGKEETTKIKEPSMNYDTKSWLYQECV